ncbi:hypothetical protein LJR225_003733 [Phenylobacterium sp. LjRoot225]|uniref:hypothetical protein n=1 Tax=Phenylobacterium sp. LjRoot225 TaxID=3342285 RepID=UPI003ECD0F82
MRRGRRREYDDSPRPSVANPREVLLSETLAFVRAASECVGVRRISLLGSLATLKPAPKDTDVLVLLDEGLDLAELAPIGRRLKGRCNAINLAADVFLAEGEGRYIGRICRYRECRPRTMCEAHHCGLRGQRVHLNDDLHLVTLAPALVAAPPFDLWPTVVRRAKAPVDVEALLLAPLEGHSPDRDQGAGGNL